ncbi:hypothetical protein CMV30_17155 [Nibricoccus aquaticus]|uniref:Uncharacterized protein n=1 Tax=Nibricoccus aquaticus TaxID=2576891 RepID=A0A290QBB2_9BACT|nr:hypothetical protein CMV30_17155 [Nibricoccus aquaticus]
MRFQFPISLRQPSARASTHTPIPLYSALPNAASSKNPSANCNTHSAPQSPDCIVQATLLPLIPSIFLNQ